MDCLNLSCWSTCHTLIGHQIDCHTHSELYTLSYTVGLQLCSVLKMAFTMLYSLRVLHPLQSFAFLLNDPMLAINASYDTGYEMRTTGIGKSALLSINTRFKVAKKFRERNFRLAYKF